MNTALSRRPIGVISAIVSLVLIASLIGWAVYPRDPAAQLAQRLKSPDAEVRYKAAKELEELGANAQVAVEQLSVALSDIDPKVRYRSAKALSKVGEFAGAAVPGLMLALQDPDREVRYYSAKTLYKIGDDAQPRWQAAHTGSVPAGALGHPRRR